MPQDIRICQFLPKFRFLAKFNIILHNIEGSERPDFLSTHLHFHLVPQGASKVPRDIGIQLAIQVFAINELLAKFSIRLHNIIIILNQHTHTYTLSKLVEDAHRKHFIWPLGGLQNTSTLDSYKKEI